MFLKVNDLIQMHSLVNFIIENDRKKVFNRELKFQLVFQSIFNPELKSKRSRAELKILQLELWLEPARLGLITTEYVSTFAYYTRFNQKGKLHELGHQVGSRLLDLVFVREKAAKRETKLLNVLLFVKSTLWKTLFGKEADKLEHANDDERTYYIIEKEPLVNKFISVPKDKGMLNLEFDKLEV